MKKTESNAFHALDNLHGKILEQLPMPVLAIDRDFKIMYMNGAGCEMLDKPLDKLAGKFCYDMMCTEHCNTAECRMRQAMAGKEVSSVRCTATISGQVLPIEYTADALRNEKGEIVGGLEYIIDISEIVEKEAKLKEQRHTIMEISTPVIKLWEKILILPIVGVVDSYRAQQMMDTMLTKLKETASKIIILDIQGVVAVDSAVANHLIKIAKATRLMGCRCIISGISPAVAQTLVHLGIDLGTVMTNFSLQEALADAFAILDYTVSSKRDS